MKHRDELSRELEQIKKLLRQMESQTRHVLTNRRPTNERKTPNRKRP